jgi:hypothetical protein
MFSRPKAIAGAIPNIFGTFFILVAFLFYPDHGNAQQNRPIRPHPKTTIKYEVDEDGKMTSLPAGFALKNGSTYNFEITVKAPNQHFKDLVTYLKEKIKTAQDKLEDPNVTNGKSYSYLFGSQVEFDEFKRELDDLYNVLDAADPKTAFGATLGSDDFRYFLGRTFWDENLFGKIFNGKSNISATPINQDLSKDAKISGSQKVETDDFTVKIWIADLQRQFIAAYYNESRKQLAPILDTLRVKAFYKNTVEKEIPMLVARFKADSGKLVDLNKQNKQVICDPELYKNIADFKNRAQKNALINLLRYKWMANWVWYNEGDLKLNPMDFTDDKLLNLKTGYNDSLATYYDQYIKSAADLMATSKDLNNQKISVKLYDSLNRQRGNGKVIYSYDAENAAAKQQNKKSADDFAAYNTLINALKFRVLAEGTLSDYFLKSYDASDTLKRLKSNQVEAIPNETTMETNAYNLQSGQDFSVAETVTDAPETSKFMKDVNDFASLGSGLTDQASQAKAILSNVLPQLNKFTPILPSIALTPVVADRPSTLAVQDKVRLAQPPTQRGQRYYIQLKFEGDDLKILTLDKHNRRVVVYNISEDIIKSLHDKGLDDCGLLLANIKAEIKKNVAVGNLSFDNTGDFNDAVRSKLADVQSKVLFAIKDQLKQLDVETAFDQISSYYQLLKIAQLLQLSGAYILPPKKIAIKDGDDPQYFNKLVPVSAQTTSKQMALKLTVTDPDSKKDPLTKNDSYITSPSHWLTASLGIAYIFNEFTRNSATVTNGVITNTPDQAQVRLMGGIHFHLKPIIMTDNSFMGISSGNVLSRISLFGGVSFPDALNNLHAGLSLEPWPGLDLTGGVHYYRFTKYTIVDDQITDQHSYYVYNKFFVSLTIEPVTFVKLIGLFK